jgi:hypothetical protein
MFAVPNRTRLDGFPVISAVDGYTYERGAILTWIIQKKNVPVASESKM